MSIKLISRITPYKDDGTPEPGEKPLVLSSTVQGNVHGDEKHCVFSYTEKNENGEMISRVVYQNNVLEIERKGAAITSLKIQVGVTTKSFYVIPHLCDIPIEVVGEKIEYHYTEKKIQLFASYFMNLGGTNQRNEISLEWENEK